MTTRVLIADDHDLVRHGFRMVLDAQPDMTVVDDVADGEAALASARRLKPDVVLADIRMPKVTGIEVVRRLTTSKTASAKVIVVTTFDDDEYVRTALGAGAAGFVLKRSGPALLVEAIRAAVAGDALISPSLTVRLLRGSGLPVSGMPGASVTASGPGPAVVGSRHGAAGLSEREEQVVKLLADGLTNVEIGAELYITPGTVKTHIANAQRKIGARNRVSIAAWAWRTGLVGP